MKSFETGIDGAMREMTRMNEMRQRAIDSVVEYTRASQACAKERVDMR
jgi:hypothetical protein